MKILNCMLWWSTLGNAFGGWVWSLVINQTQPAHALSRALHHGIQFNILSLQDSSVKPNVDKIHIILDTDSIWKYTYLRTIMFKRAMLFSNPWASLPIFCNISQCFLPMSDAYLPISLLTARVPRHPYRFIISSAWLYKQQCNDTVITNTYAHDGILLQLRFYWD